MERILSVKELQELYKRPEVVDPKNPTTVYPNLTVTVNPYTRRLLISCGYTAEECPDQITAMETNGRRIRIPPGEKKDESVQFAEDCINSYYNS